MARKSRDPGAEDVHEKVVHPEVKPKYVVTREVLEESMPQALTLNASNQVRWNPVSMAAFNACQERNSHVGFQELTRERWAADQVPKGIDGAVKLRRHDNDRTAMASFGPVLARRPDLKVEKGRLRLIPWEIEPVTNRFILRLDLEENIPAPKRQKKRSLTEVHPVNL